jgi:hypothetical protein
MKEMTREAAGWLRRSKTHRDMMIPLLPTEEWIGKIKQVGNCHCALNTKQIKRAP